MTGDPTRDDHAMSTVTKRRVARQAHFADCCGRGIPAGYVYLLHTAFPGDLVDKIGQSRECAVCAKRYGRDHMLGDIPLMEQLYGEGLA